MLLFIVLTVSEKPLCHFVTSPLSGEKTYYKKLNKQETQDTDEIIKKLLDDSPLEEKNHDHELTGNYSGYRECHVHQDLLLVYKKDSDECALMMTCYRISSHTNIFDIKKSQKK